MCNSKIFVRVLSSLPTQPRFTQHHIVAGIRTHTQSFLKQFIKGLASLSKLRECIMFKNVIFRYAPLIKRCIFYLIIGLLILYGTACYVSTAHAVTEIRAEITAYSSTREETDNDPFTTASGKRVFDGAAACPIFLPFGTRFCYRGKVYTCVDRMGAKYRGKNYFDIWVKSSEEARQFGRRKNELVKILD